MDAGRGASRPRLNAAGTLGNMIAVVAGDPGAVGRRRVGRYRVLRRLAAGGMAELHLAHVEGVAGFEKVVVLKRILPHLQDETDFIEMFVKEARLSAILDHPNIVQVLDSGRFRGEFFYVMEYVHGKDARTLLRAAAKAGQMPLDCAVSLVIGAASGLHYAHERADLSGRPLGLVHRDVSPSNVLVSYDGAVKVSDFGIAKASAQTDKTLGSTIKGKIAYMAPEQARGAAVDRRTDVYALGILLYELSLTQRAFFADSEFAVFNHVLSGALDRPSERDPAYPPELERIVLKAVALDPTQRYPTARALVDDLEAFAGQTGLRCGVGAVARFVEAVFGRPEYPRAEPDSGSALPLTDDGTVVLMPVGVGAAAARRPAPRWPLAVGLGGIAIGVAVAVARPFGGPELVPAAAADDTSSRPENPSVSELETPSGPPQPDVAAVPRETERDAGVRAGPDARDDDREAPPHAVERSTPQQPDARAEGSPTRARDGETPARRKKKRKKKRARKTIDPDALYPL